MNVSSAYSLWFESIVVLGLGTLGIVLFALIADRWLHTSSSWRRTIWQSATIAILVLVVFEVSGVGRTLSRWAAIPFTPRQDRYASDIEYSDPVVALQTNEASTAGKASTTNERVANAPKEIKAIKWVDDPANTYRQAFPSQMPPGLAQVSFHDAEFSSDADGVEKKDALDYFRGRLASILTPLTRLVAPHGEPSELVEVHLLDGQTGKLTKLVSPPPQSDDCTMNVLGLGAKEPTIFHIDSYWKKYHADIAPTAICVLLRLCRDRLGNLRSYVYCRIICNMTQSPRSSSLFPFPFKQMAGEAKGWRFIKSAVTVLPLPSLSFNASPPSAPPVASPLETVNHFPTENDANTVSLVSTSPPTPTSTVTTDRQKLAMLARVILGVTLFWLVGIFVILLYRVRAHLALLMFRRRHRHRVPVSDALRQRVDQLSQQLGLRGKVHITEVSGLTTPVAFGIFTRTIGLPLGFADDFDPRDQEVMLAHELSHLASRDPAWLLAADFVTALLWWHPAIWWMRRRLQMASEAAADEACVLVPDGPNRLAACLVEFGHRLTDQRRLGWLHITGGGFRSGLGRRVARLLCLDATVRENNPSCVRLLTVKWLFPFFLVFVVIFSTTWARSRSAFAQGDSEMRVLKSSWCYSLGALALIGLAGPSANQALAHEGAHEGHGHGMTVTCDEKEGECETGEDEFRIYSFPAGEVDGEECETHQFSPKEVREMHELMERATRQMLRQMRAKHGHADAKKGPKKITVIIAGPDGVKRRQIVVSGDISFGFSPHGFMPHPPHPHHPPHHPHHPPRPHHPPHPPMHMFPPHMPGPGFIPPHGFPGPHGIKAPAPKIHHLMIAIQNLHAAGLHEEAAKLEARLPKLIRELREEKRNCRPDEDDNDEGFFPCDDMDKDICPGNDDEDEDICPGNDDEDEDICPGDEDDDEDVFGEDEDEDEDDDKFESRDRNHQLRDIRRAMHELQEQIERLSDRD